MLLFLFYNADLLSITENEDGSYIIAFVDDATLVVIGRDFFETTETIIRIMEKRQGGFEWSTSSNSPYELDKFAVMHCEAPCTRDPRPRPALTLRGHLIKEVDSMRQLGIFIDRKLDWHVQAKYAVGRAASYSLAFSRLAKARYGLDPHFMRTLYKTVAFTKMTYGLDVWYTPIHRKPGAKKQAGNVGFTKDFERVQNIAARAISGAMRFSPTGLVDAHAGLLPIGLALNRVCHRAATRLCSLPPSHPLFSIVRRCQSVYVRRHRTNIHELLEMYSLRPDVVETVFPAKCPPAYSPAHTTTIAEDDKASKRMDDADHSTYRVYTDGSGFNGSAGAAAVIYKRGQGEIRSVRYHLGSLKRYGTYEAELVGMALGIHLL
ncbi:hypothetical protein HDZ31DRAFT_49687, partial [Schizophyllum fasciatum]